MAKNFNLLRAGMSEQAQAKSAAKAEAMLAEMHLQAIRKDRQFTQVQLASELNIEQAAVSKLESRTDMYISTLRDYIKALGGELQLIAKFPDTQFRLHDFRVAT